MATAKKGEYKGHTNVVTLRTLSRSRLCLGLCFGGERLWLLVDGSITYPFYRLALIGVVYWTLQCSLCANTNAVIHGVGACFWNEQKPLAVDSLRLQISRA